MIYVCIADLHCRYKKDVMFIDGVPETIHFPLLNLTKAAHLVKKYRSEGKDACLIICGDFVHTKVLHQRTIAHVNETLEEVYSICNSDVYGMLGNHDYDYDSDDRIYSFLSGRGNIAEPDNAIVFDEFCLIAYRHDIEKMYEEIVRHSENKKVVFGHFGILEAQLSSSNFRCGDFSVKQLESFPCEFILGHYHKPQVVSSKIRYVGSPCPIHFSERGEEKRILVYDSEHGKYSELETEYPQVVEIILDKTTEIPNSKDIEQKIEESFSRFYFTVDETENKVIKKLEQLQKKYPHYVFVKKVAREKLEQIKEEQVQTLENVSIDAILNTYLDLKNIDILERPKHLAIARQFL